MLHLRSGDRTKAQISLPICGSRPRNHGEGRGAGSAIVNAVSAGRAIIAATKTPTAGRDARPASQITAALPSAPPPSCPAFCHADALACAGAESIVTKSPPHATDTVESARPAHKRSAIICPKWEASIKGIAKQKHNDDARAPITSQVLRRSLTSTSGAQRNWRAAGR